MTLTREQLETNAKKWEEQIEMLARHLCVEMGIDPDAHYAFAVKEWEMHTGDASKYLRNRVMNRFYWETLAGQNTQEGI